MPVLRMIFWHDSQGLAFFSSPVFVIRMFTNEYCLGCIPLFLVKAFSFWIAASSECFEYLPDVKNVLVLNPNATKVPFLKMKVKCNDFRTEIRCIYFIANLIKDFCIFQNRVNQGL